MDAIPVAAAYEPGKPLNKEVASQPSQGGQFPFFPLYQLPSEVLGKYLLPCLSLQDVCACSLVNRRFRDIIKANHVKAVSFCRNFCSSRITEKSRERYQTVLRPWLHQFGQSGRDAIAKLDKKTDHAQFPQLLFYSIAQTLGRTEKLAVSQAGTFDEASRILNMSFSPDGMHAIARLLGPGARLYRLVAGKWQSEIFISPDSWVGDGAFSADSSQVVTTSWKRQIRLHKFIGNHWQEQASLQYADKLYVSAISGKCQVAVSGNFKVIIYGYDGAQWQQEFNLDCEVDRPAVRFSPDEKHFALACNDLLMYQLVDGKWQFQKTVAYSCLEPVATFSPDGSRLLSLAMDLKVKIHHLVAGEWQESDSLPVRNYVVDASFSPDCRHVMLLLRMGLVTFLSCVRGVWQINATIEYSDSVAENAFSPDSVHAMTVCLDKTVRIFQQAGGQWQEKTQIKFNDTILYARFSPCGTHIVGTADDGDARIYGLVNGEWHMKCSIEDVFSGCGATFSPIGGYLSTTSIRTVNFFTLISGRLSASDDVEL